MKTEEFSMNRPVSVKTCDGKIKDGVLKGIYEGTDGAIKATVEYQQPIQNNFVLDDVTVK